MSTTTRREFIKIAGLGAAALGVSQSAFARNTLLKGTKAISLEACQSMTPLEIANQSTLEQQSWEIIKAETSALKDKTIRSFVFNALNNPKPMLLERLDGNARNAIWQELTAKGYTKESVENFLPPAPKSDKDVLFYAAPGSGYQSHHGYPGGLATHVATNALITRSIVKTYQDVYGYSVNGDIAMAAQLLHDLHKPYVFQWQQDGSSRTEQPLAKTGEHHTLSIAESIVRKAPAALIVAQACAHTHPGSPDDEAQVVGWIKAASIIAGVDPVKYGLLATGGNTLPMPHQQEGFICHLGDHDFVLSVPAVKTTLPVIKEIASRDYGISDNDLNGKPFNALRNTVYASFSAMRIHEVMGEKGKEGVRQLMHSAVQPVKA